MPISDSLMRDSLTREPYLGSGAYGPVYDTAETVSGVYAEPTTTRVTTREGKEIVASLFIMAAGSATFTDLDRITWEGGTYEVITASPMRPRGVLHHWEVYCASVAPVGA